MSAEENLPLRTLLRIVHLQQPADEARIASILRLVNLSVTLRRAMRRLVMDLGLSDHAFAALVALYTLDPEPVTPADLAYHIDSPGPTVTATVGRLVRSGHVAREHDRHRRGTVRLHLTATGRALAADAVTHTLKAAARLSCHLPRETSDAVARFCERLEVEAREFTTRPSGAHPFFA